MSCPAGAVLAAFVQAPAYGQTNGPETIREQAPFSEEIVVTAQRQSELLQSVPISIAAFTSQNLERQQIAEAADLQLALPNTTFSRMNFTYSSFTLRGVGDLCVGASCDQATGVHSDGLPTPSTLVFETQYFDMERIEVLLGPQGTLFGRNATSGVINLVPAKPDLSGFKASFEGEYGNYDAIGMRGMVNIPIGHALAVRASGFYSRHDGYTLNLFDGRRIDDRNMYAFRTALRWQPTPDTTLDVMGYHFSEDDHRMRIQKQLCHHDPTGVLGCLPDYRANEYFNANAQVVATLPSVQSLRALGGPVLGPAFAALAIADLTGPDALAGQSNPADDRIVNTPYTPYYKASETQIQARLQHDFPQLAFQLQGLYAKSHPDSGIDASLSAFNRSAYANGLATLESYAAHGIPGIPGSQAFFVPAAAALIPSGSAGVLCSSKPTDSNTGVFGGHRVCASSAINDDSARNVTRTITAEALLTSKLDGPINFLLGMSYLDNKLTDGHYSIGVFGADYSAAILGALTALGRTLQLSPTPPSYLGPSFFDNTTSEFRLKSYGIFGEIYLKPSERINITTGLRYSIDRKTLRARSTLFNFLVPYGTTDAFASPFAAGYDADPATACPASGSTTAGAYGSVPGCEAFQVSSSQFKALTGRAVFKYNLDDDNMLYASYSRGFKSGGINPPLAAGLDAPTTFRPEFINAFEIGMKNKFMNGLGILSTSLFYYDYRDMQISRLVNRTAINDNVNARVYGAEIEAILRPVRGMKVNLGASILRTKVTGDLQVQDTRNPAAGRDDVVVLKDILAAYNCVVSPNVAGNGAGSRQLVTLVNSSLGLPVPVNFPANSGVVATGTFGLCNAVASIIANPSDALRNLFNAPIGALPFSVTNVGLTQNIKGKQLPQAPSYKLTVGMQYTFKLRNERSIVPRIDFIRVGPSYGNIFNGSVNRISGYSQINAQIQFEFINGSRYVRLFVQNLTNDNAVTGLAVNDQSQGLATNVFTLEPRRYGVVMGMTF
jgi:outer membrane receptor protein involved in Fe transport